MQRLFDHLAVPADTYDGGRLLRAPYGMRKLEAALQAHFGREAVATVDGDHVASFVDQETQIVGVATMNPLGLNPLTQIGQYFGGSESFAVREFRALMIALRNLRTRRGLRCRIIVGGTGALEFVNLSPDVRAEIMERLGIDHVVYGEVDVSAPILFQEILEGKVGETVLMNEFNKRHGLPAFGRVEDLPLITQPTMYDLVEVMRGCGRNCTFCEPNLRAARHMPFDGFVEKEISVNLRAGGRGAWLHSEDIWLYRVEDRRTLAPNEDAIVDLFGSAARMNGVREPPHPTHGTIAPIVYNTRMLERVTQAVTGGRREWLGIQTGLETGSVELYRKMMPLKAKPFSPEEWPQVVADGTIIFNRNLWFPVYTLIIGYPGETIEDVQATIDLMRRLEKEVPERVGRPRAHWFIGPFPWIAWGVFKGEKSFNLEEDLSKTTDGQGNLLEDSRLALKRVELFELCYRHMVRELTMPARGVLASPWLSAGFVMFGPVGYVYLSHLVESAMAKLRRRFQDELDASALSQVAQVAPAR